LQLENGHSLFDYSIGLNEKVQLMIQTAVPKTSEPEDQEGVKDNDPVCNGSDKTNLVDSESAATGEEMEFTDAPINSEESSSQV
jgi:E3 ubiquitin-protein ligase UHRF1